ncbi:MAG: hypothetical protein JXA22_02305 [Candidatus Thermoplasmatota archaeon]|nr:hypothetical protein [Candidatus Thermoplasmatota archaeon]
MYRRGSGREFEEPFWDINCIAAVMIALLILPVSGVGWGSRESRADELDLAVEDLSMIGGWGVLCRLGKISGEIAGSFYVNLSYWGVLAASYNLYWMPDENGKMEVIYENPIPWNLTKVVVSVKIEFSTADNEQNLSNDIRTERWFRDLPDLYVSMVYRDRTSGNTTAIIGNRGMIEANTWLYTGIWVNGTLEDHVEGIYDLAPGETVPIQMNWSWDPSLSPVRLSVAVDPYNWVGEMDDHDNYFNITWRRLDPLEFSDPPEVSSTGIRNATIGWSTSVPTRCFVRYGRVSSNLASTGQTALALEGSVELTGLSPRTQYIFEVLASDENGRSLVSGQLTFTTKPLFSASMPSGSFSPGALQFGQGVHRVPFQASDGEGIQRVDMLIDGNLVMTQAGMGRGNISGMDHDFSIYVPGDHHMTIVVTDGEDHTFTFSSAFQVLASELGTMHVTIISTSEVPITNGVFWLTGTCRDPGGVASAAWFIDGTEVDRVSREVITGTLNMHYTWFTVDDEDGPHNVTLRAWNAHGDMSEQTRSFLVHNIVEPGDPNLVVERGDVTIDGTHLVSHLTVTNAGGGAARDIVVKDIIYGFVPLDGDEGTYSFGNSGVYWIVARRIDHIQAGASREITFELIPAFNPGEGYCIGYTAIQPGTAYTYTTFVTYSRLDGVIGYGDYMSLPRGYMSDGEVVDAGAYQAYHGSNYLMMTCGEALYDNLPPGTATDEVLKESARLLDLRDGVFGFIDNDPPNGLSEYSVRQELTEWARYMKPGYSSDGYLAILGEDEIIPVWEISGVQGSDIGYALLGGATMPELIVGRFIGRTADEILIPLRTAIGVIEGALLNDHTGAATLITTAGEGAATFQGNGEDLYELLSPLMEDVRLFPRGEILDRRSFDVEFDGVREHMAAGDLEMDGRGEVVTISPEEDVVRIIDSIDGGIQTFPLQIMEGAVVMIGNIYGGPDKEILVAQDVGGESVVQALDRSGNLLVTIDPAWEPDFPISIVDYDGQGLDDLVIGSTQDDHLRVYSPGNVKLYDRSMTEFDITPGSNLYFIDMDYDGVLDIVNIDYLEGWYYVLFSSGLDMWRGLVSTGAGGDVEPGYIQSNGTGGLFGVYPSSDIAVGMTLQPYYFDPDILQMKGDPFNFRLDGPCSVDVVEVGGNDGPCEIAVCCGEPENRLVIMDYGRSRENLQSKVAPFMTDRDLLFFRDHGDVDQWCDIYYEDEVGALGIDEGTHRPVVFSSACLTGRYHDNDTSFARAMVLAGVGVFIGATETSYRSTNNEAISMVEDWAEGMPIGAALRKFMREIQGDDPKWVREYNLYGDPAFGVSSGQTGFFEAMPLYLLQTRSGGSMGIDLGEVRIRNITEGTEASFPGSRQYEVEGMPPVPYKELIYDVPFNMSTSTVSIRMSGTWEYLDDINIPLYTGGSTDDRKSRSSDAEDNRTVDPEDPWYPRNCYEWTVSELPSGNTTLVIRIFPFQYDMYSMSARYCRYWSADIDLFERPARFLEVEGPNNTLRLGDVAEVSFEVGPIGAGGVVSLSSWVENASGVFLEELRSTLLNINSTTLFEISWDVPDHVTGHHSICLELRSESGNPLGTRRFDISVGVVSAVISSLHVSPDTFNDTSLVQAWALISNLGELKVEGSLRVSLLDMEMHEELYDVFGISLDAGEEVNLSTSFDMRGLSEGSYILMARSTFQDGGSSKNRIIFREGSPLTPSVLNIIYTGSPGELRQGDTLCVNGTVTWSNGSVVRDIAIAIWLDDGRPAARSRTDGNGTFGLRLVNLSSGDWNLTVFAFAGDISSEVRGTLIVNSSGGPDDDDIIDDDILDDDIDDDVTDDDVTDDDVTDDDDDIEGIVRLLCVLGLGSIIVLMLAVVTIMVVLRIRSRRETDEWEE